MVDVEVCVASGRRNASAVHVEMKSVENVAIEQTEEDNRERNENDGHWLLAEPVMCRALRDQDTAIDRRQHEQIIRYVRRRVDEENDSLARDRVRQQLNAVTVEEKILERVAKQHADIAHAQREKVD